MAENASRAVIFGRGPPSGSPHSFLRPWPVIRVIARRTRLAAGASSASGAALGARPADVSGLVIRYAALLVVLGLALGLPVAHATAQQTRSLFFRYLTTSPLVFAVAVAALAATAGIAAFLFPRAGPVARTQWRLLQGLWGLLAAIG